MLFAQMLLGAGAAELQMVRSFSGRDGARVLFVADAPLDMPTLRRERVDEGMLLHFGLPALSLDPALVQAYGRADGVAIVEPGTGLVAQIRMEGGVDLTLRARCWCDAQVIPVGDRALLLDLQVPGAKVDPTLPDAEILARLLREDAVTPARPLGSRPLIVLDPGHGGDEHGATGLSGTEEADVALAIALRTARRLEAELDVDVVLTREDDTFVPLERRAQLANSLGATLFISIHANAAPGPTAWGIETYTLDVASDAGAARVAARENALIRESPDAMGEIAAQLTVDGTTALSRDLAGKVHNEVIRSLREVYGEEQIRDLGVKTALFYVLVGTRMPAILFEAGFLTRADDEMRLRTATYQETTAEAITRAVEAWLKSQETAP